MSQRKTREVELSQPQMDFITSDAFALLFSAGIGCMAESTLVDTPTGPKAFAELSGNITAFDGRSLTPALSSLPFPKGKGNLYRVVHERGQFVAFESHLTLSSAGKFEPVRRLKDVALISHENSFAQPYSILDACLLALRTGERRYSQTVAGFLERYLAYCRQCDLPLLPGLDTVRGFVPLLTDVLECARDAWSLAFARTDDQAGPAPGRNHLGRLHAPRSTTDCARPSAAPAVVAADHVSKQILERIWRDTLQLPISLATIVHRHLSALLGLGRTLVYALTSPYASSRVLSTEKVGFDWYWDVQVPNFHNYVSEGVVHHNSGKSFVGSLWCKDQLALEPKAKGFIGANTYKQLHNATLATFFGVLDDYNIPWSYNQKFNVIKAAGRTIYAYSLENFDSVRGIEVGWIWLDETRDTHPDAFRVVLGRLRDKNAKRPRIRLTSSPNGFDWLYDKFAGPDKVAGYEVVYGATMDNSFLPEGYADALKADYDEKAYRQEVLGQFVNLTQGAIYYGFQRKKHVMPIKRDPGVPVRVALDFNVNPMSAVAIQDYDHTIHVIKEYSFMSSNTHELAEAITADFGIGTEVIPDSTGKALKTASRGLSDHEILRQAGLRVLTNRNPARMDRYNCVNNLLEKERIKIDPSCKALIRDLEKVSYKEGTNQPDTSDHRLTHISDALGYGCWWSYPIVRISSGVSNIR